MCSAFGAGDEHCEPAVESEHDEDDAVVDIVNAGGSANEQDTSGLDIKLVDAVARGASRF